MDIECDIISIDLSEVEKRKIEHDIELQYERGCKLISSYIDPFHPTKLNLVFIKEGE